MADRSENAPPLASLVLAGEKQTDAVQITDFLHMVHDISNVYLLTGNDGDVLINAGFPNSAARNADLLRPQRRGPLRYIILTQSHGDHYGGVPHLREPETKVVGGPDFVMARTDTDLLQPFFGPRSAKLWGRTMGEIGPLKQPDPIDPDIIVDRELVLEASGRRLEIISTPEGETVDSLTVWLPQEKIAFVGNFFGPIWLSMPFLNTLRGDKPRLVRNYLRSLERIRDLGAELMITGHGEPIAGAAKIREDLDRMHAAVSFVRDYTLEGMNAGKSVHELMNDFTWPDSVAIGEFHGKASWAIRSIWHEYSGWFRYQDGTTALYGVPQSSVHADLVELAGGATVLADRARERLSNGEPLKALHLVGIALSTAPGNRDAVAVKRDASLLLLDRSGSTNLSETMWLRSEIADCEALLG